MQGLEVKMADSGNPNQMVFGLDIGTRSIVGTVGYKRGNKFVVVAQCNKEHAWTHAWCNRSY